MITAAINFLKEKTIFVWIWAIEKLFFKEKICLTTVPISIELNQYKNVWKGKKTSCWALQLLPFFSVIYNFNNSSIMEGD